MTKLIPSLESVIGPALKHLSDASLDEVMQIYNDEKRRRKLALSNSKFTLLPDAMVDYLTELAEDAEMDNLVAAFDALDGRDTATYDEGSGVFEITTTVAKP